MADTTGELSSKSAAMESTRVLLRVVRDKVSKDDILLRASALAYSTLASLVPLFAIVLAVLSGPAFQEKREGVLNALASALVPAENEWLNTDEEIQQKLEQQADFKKSFENEIKPLAERLGAVSVFGFLVLVAIVGLLFQAVEQSFNAIWRASTQRPFFMRVAIATSMMFWGPVLLAVSVSLSELLRGLPVIGTYIVPSLFSTLAFTAFYMVMPHARVRFFSALIGGVAAAFWWEIAKLLFLVYVTHVVSYNKIYGSLGLIPMLFLWVYINWLIILYGAELAYCHQNRAALVDQWLAQQRESSKSKEPVREQVPASTVLAVAIEAAQRFQARLPGGVRASQLAQALALEPGLVQRAADRLVAAGILARVAPTDADATALSDDPAYLPACDPNACDVGALLAAARDEKNTDGNGPALDCARRLLAEVSELSQQKFGSRTLADLASHCVAGSETPAPAPPGGENAAGTLNPGPG